MAPKIKDVKNEDERRDGTTEKPNLKGQEESGPDADFLGTQQPNKTDEDTDEKSTEDTQTQEDQESVNEEPERSSDDDQPDSSSDTDDAEQEEIEEITNSDEVEEKEDLSDKDQRIARLEKIIEEMSKSLDTDIDTSPQKKAEEKKEETNEDIVNSFIDGDFDDDTFDKITTNKDEFVKFLSKFGENVASKATESTMRNIPDVVSKTFKRQGNIKKAVDDFYSKNPKMKKHAKYVSYVFNQKKADNPDLSIEENLKQTEEEVRKNLALNKKAVNKEEERLRNKEKGKKNPPAKPGSGNRRQRSSNDGRTEQQKQIDNILI